MSRLRSKWYIRKVSYNGKSRTSPRARDGITIYMKWGVMCVHLLSIWKTTWDNMPQQISIASRVLVIIKEEFSWVKIVWNGIRRPMLFLVWANLRVHVGHSRIKLQYLLTEFWTAMKDSIHCASIENIQRRPWLWNRRNERKFREGRGGQEMLSEPQHFPLSEIVVRNSLLLSTLMCRCTQMLLHGVSNRNIRDTVCQELSE